eukprot:906921-Pyramimonas_sp.AAC.1
MDVTSVTGQPWRLTLFGLAVKHAFGIIGYHWAPISEHAFGSLGIIKYQYVSLGIIGLRYPSMRLVSLGSDRYPSTLLVSLDADPVPVPAAQPAGPAGPSEEHPLCARRRERRPTRGGAAQGGAGAH